MSPSSKIISLEDETESVNLLVYGKSGAGKTVFAGSADRVLFIAPEDDGTISAKRSGSKAHKWPVDNWQDIIDAYMWLYENPEEVAAKYDWVVLDSITRMQHMAMRAILDAAIAENASRDPDIPAIQDWQKYYEMFKRFVLAYNSLPVNVLYTALVRNEVDEEGNDFLTPDIQGKGYQLSQTICSYMTSYGCLQVKRRKDPEDEKKTQEYRRITWKDTGVIQGKDRTQVLAPWTNNKTLQEITDMITGRNPAPRATKATPVKRTGATRRPVAKKEAS